MREWEEVELQTLCKDVTVGFVGSMYDEYVDKGILFLRSQNILPFSLNLERSQIKYISQEFHEKIKKSKLFPGDIAIVRTGYPGTACVIPEGIGEVNCSDLVIVRPKPEVSSKFLCYFINSPRTLSLISGSTVGSAQKHFNIGIAKRLKIPLPSFFVQHKIASILSAYDDLIENNLKRIKLLEEIAQRTYEEWFVKFRVNGEHLAIDEVTGLPEGWSTKEIHYFGEVITGKTPSTTNHNNFGEEVPFVKTPDMHGSPYVTETNQKLSRIGAESQKKKFIPKNSLMVSCIGTAGVIGLAAEACQTNQQINSIVFFKEEYTFYTYCFAKGIKPLLEALGSNGATMTNVNKGKFETISMIYPTEQILKDFHRIAQPNFDSILVLQKQNISLKEARDILLPRLMSGEIDVAEVK